MHYTSNLWRVTYNCPDGQQQNRALAWQGGLFFCEELGSGLLGVAADLVEVFLFDRRPAQSLGQGSHGLGERAGQEGLGVVERNHVLVGLDKGFSGAGAWHRIGHGQHAVDRLAGVVDEADVGGALRAACDDVVGHAAQPLRDQLREGGFEALNFFTEEKNVCIKF